MRVNFTLFVPDPIDGDEFIVTADVIDEEPETNSPAEVEFIKARHADGSPIDDADTAWRVEKFCEGDGLEQFEIAAADEVRRQRARLRDDDAYRGRKLAMDYLASL